MGENSRSKGEDARGKIGNCQEERKHTRKVFEQTCDPPQAIYTSEGDEESFDIESSSSKTRRDLGRILLYHSFGLHQAPTSSILQTSPSTRVSTSPSVKGERPRKNKRENYRFQER